VRFALESSSPPVQVGTIELVSSGVTTTPLPPPIPVVAADLEVRASRPPGKQSTGDAVPFTIQVLNNGPATATNINVALYAGVDNPDIVSFSGTVVREPYATYGGAYIWPIASLAPGATATLTGTIAYPGGTLSANVDPIDLNSCQTCGRSRVGAERSIDLVWQNDYVELDAFPAVNGTADLQVSSLSLVPGSSPAIRTVSFSVKNAGPFATEHPFVSVSVGTGATLLDRHVAPAGWECTNYGCWIQGSFAVGATASFEFDVEVQTATPSLSGFVSIESDGLPDPDTGNDRKVFWLSP
jgi:hypothetical protein